MSIVPVPDHSNPPAQRTLLDESLEKRKCGVIGGGITGTLITAIAQEAAYSAGVDMDTHWAFDSSEDTASTRAGAYHAPFNTSDPRMGAWATRAWSMLDLYERMGAGHLIHEAETLYLSNLTPIPLPQGLPGEVIEVDPATIGFGGSYTGAAFVKRGRVFSPPALMPALHESLAQNRNIHVENQRHFRDTEDVVTWARKLGVGVVFVAAGASSGTLLGHENIVGSLGVLVHVPMHPDLGIHNDTVVMDEDHDESLAYTIPAPARGTIGVGGTVHRTFDMPYSPGAEYTEDFRNFKEWVEYEAQQEAKLIRARVGTRFPLMRKALGRSDLKMTYGLRPQAADVILRVLPTEQTDGIVIAEVGGLGGSGITIAPAVAAEALSLPFPVNAESALEEASGE
jgi:hypothetical protein